MSSLIVLLGWLLDASSLKTWSDAIFARFAGPSDGDYPVHRAIWAMCRNGRYQDARRLASSRWEWTKSLRIGRDFIHILLRLGETKRAIEIADHMASQDADSPWPRILVADLLRFFGKDEDKALSMYKEAVPACEAMLPDSSAMTIVNQRLAGRRRKRGLITEASVDHGDTAALSPSAVAIMQGRVLMEGTVPISRWARFIAKRFTGMNPTAISATIALTSPLTAQAALEEAGTLRILVAALAGAAGRLFKTSGWFDLAAGPRVAQIKGTPGSDPPYDYYVIVGARDASGLSTKTAGARFPFAGFSVWPYLKTIAKGLAWTAAAASVAGETVATHTRSAMKNPRTRRAIMGVLLVAVLSTLAAAWLDKSVAANTHASVDTSVQVGIPVQVDTPVPVLLYHDLTADGVPRNGMTVPVHEFREQMTHLKESGYYAITTSQLEAYLTGKGSLPDRPVLITFDDGYESVYTLAYPVLREFGLRATAFVVGTTARTANHLTFEQMREMSASGVVEIASHTYAGHGGSSAAPDIASWTEEQITADLSTITAVLRAERVPMAPAFAYPFGDPSPSLVSAVRKLGFTIAFTTENGLASGTRSLLHQRRVTVWPGGGGALFLQRIDPSFWLEDAE